MRAQLTLMLMTTALLVGVAEAQTLRDRWRAQHAEVTATSAK